MMPKAIRIVVCADAGRRMFIMKCFPSGISRVAITEFDAVPFGSELIYQQMLSNPPGHVSCEMPSRFVGAWNPDTTAAGAS
jgi:hypothetical protein